MSLNPMGTVNYNWNYSRPDKPDYSLELWGTVVSIQEVQARAFNPSGQPGAPQFWPDGNPKMNIRVGFATPDGSLKAITFAKAGKAQVAGQKPSLHMELYRLTNNNMLELIGKTVHLVTWPTNPTTGMQWGQGNPRIFIAEEAEGDIKYELSSPLPYEFTVPELYANDAVSGGQPVQQPQPAQYPQYPQQMQQPQYPQYPQQMHQSAPMPQPAQVQQVPQPQGMTANWVAPQASVTAQQPSGMDPAIAQAMAMQSQELYGDIDF